jgi:dihydroflavonol-4-reductase
VLGGQDVTLGQMLADIAALVGRKPPKVKLPIAPLFPIAAVAELGGMLTGKEPFVTLDSLRMARHRMFYSSARAQVELGYHARPYLEALRDAVDWFRDAGMIDDPARPSGCGDLDRPDADRLLDLPRA